VDEAELVELQRNALELFQKLDDFTEGEEDCGRVSRKILERLEDFTDMAHEISNAVDALTDYVRHIKQQEVSR
jgi:cytochrome c556